MSASHLYWIKFWPVKKFLVDMHGF